MKKRIAIFVVLAMVICLALTGCGQKTNQTEKPNNQQTDNAATNVPGNTEEHENGGITQSDEDSYADDAAKDRENEQTPNTPANNGSYTWQVGDYTLTTKININDYIDGNVWRANEMAAALGWDPVAAKTDGSYQVSMSAKRPAYYEGYGLLLYYSRADTQCNGLLAYIKGEDSIFSVSFRIDIGDYKYRMNDSELYWTFEEIVCFAYALENAPSTNDPFNGLLHTDGLTYSYN